MIQRVEIIQLTTTPEFLSGVKGAASVSDQTTGGIEELFWDPHYSPEIHVVVERVSHCVGAG